MAVDQQHLPVIHTETGQWAGDELSRRRFLEASLLAVTGAATVGVGSVAARFLVGKSLETPPATWVQIAQIATLPPGTVHRAQFAVRATDVWRKIEQKGLAYLYSEDGTTYTALDATCSHLGCVVHWQETEQHFACPCHAGHFQRDGAVIDGPPPRPLRKLATKIEDGALWIEI